MRNWKLEIINPRFNGKANVSLSAANPNSCFLSRVFSRSGVAV